VIGPLADRAGERPGAAWRLRHSAMGSRDISPLEITVKAVALGVLLSVVLAAANAYLGLFAGMTVSASIPAAVVSLGVLRLFRRSGILENNICLLYTSPSPRDRTRSRMPSSA